MVSLEISVDSLQSAAAAESGGAQRIELCSALREGGLTPSLGLIRAVRSRVKLPLFVLIRPRSGDFLYADEEIDVMREDIHIAAQEGVDGVVLGVLTEEADIDLERTRALVEMARPMEVTFHRAFDMTRSIDAALEDVIGCGADRVLTSGGGHNAIEGSQQLRKLVQQARGRISVVVGGGVRPGNIAELIQDTGAHEFHSSLRRNRKSPMKHQAHAVHLGEAAVNDYVRGVVEEQDVQELVRSAGSTVRAAVCLRQAHPS